MWVSVQDLGLSTWIKENIPALPLHASTQMTVHNLEGVLNLEKLGFTRAVLSRETSIHEINDILGKYKSDDIKRYINYPIMNAIVPIKFLSNFLNTYFPNSVSHIITLYSSGIFTTVLLWVLLVIYIIFDNHYSLYTLIQNYLYHMLEYILFLLYHFYLLYLLLV